MNIKQTVEKVVQDPILDF